MATKAHLEGNKRYLEKLDEIKIRVAKGDKTIIQEHAAKMKESTNAFIKRSIDETMERDFVNDGD